MAERPALPCRDDVVVENGAAAPKWCLLSLEMRSPTVAGGLIPTGEASIATRTTFNQPTLRLYSIKETNSKTPTPYVSYDSSFFQTNNLPAALSCRGVIETKSGENRMFDPGGSHGRLRACPFWDRGARCFVGRFMLGLGEAAALFGGSMIRDSKSFRRAVRAKYLCRGYSKIAGPLKLGRL